MPGMPTSINGRPTSVDQTKPCEKTDWWWISAESMGMEVTERDQDSSLDQDTPLNQDSPPNQATVDPPPPLIRSDRPLTFIDRIPTSINGKPTSVNRICTNWNAIGADGVYRYEWRCIHEDSGDELAEPSSKELAPIVDALCDSGYMIMRIRLSAAVVLPVGVFALCVV
jgi:hypothetical protein